MRTYKRINEDFLDKTDMQLDNVSVLDDVRAELDNWFSDGPELTFNPCLLPDAFYPVDDETLFKATRKIFNVCGYKCNLNWLDVSKVTQMTSLFRTTDFNGDISRWDVSSVLDMYAMFCYSDFVGDISNWNTKSVTDMSYMFAGTTFNGDISRWDVSSVLDMSNMFENSMFNEDISGWDVSSVTNHVDMFKGCPIQDGFKPHGFRDEVPDEE